MRAILAVAALALLASAAVAVGDEPAGEVLVLNDDNFASIVPAHDVLLVEFYAPWCGHCKALEPKYNEAAKLLAASPETANIRIAKMDADSQKKVPGQFGVSGFPTIKLFRNGEVAGDYDGERTAEAIVEFMKKKAASAVNKEFTDGAALKKLLKNPSNPTLVALCSSKDHLDFKYYKQVVSKFADNGIDIYHAAAPSVLEAFGYYASGCLIQLVRPNAKPQKVTYQGTIFKDKLREWIVSNVVTPFAKYTPESQKLFTQLGKNLVRIVRDDKAAPVDVKALEPLAKTFEEKFFFTVSDLKDYQAEVDAHCAKGAKKCVLLQDPKGKVFGMDSGDITVATITEFIEAFNAKKLKVKVKSEATPAPPKAGEVAVIVGTTFESEVLESDKDVFIEFYAPWCGHCKALAPKYDQLASEMADQFDKVTIAKIDLTNNDLPADMKSVYEVSGFPTIYFAPKGKKNKPIKYEGQREVADLKKWVTEHLSS